MRIRATCHACTSSFLLFELYGPNRRHDRCPRCGAGLGGTQVWRQAHGIDAAATELLRSVQSLAARGVRLTVEIEPFCDTVAAAAATGSSTPIPTSTSTPARRRFGRSAA